ncbi:MAG TPA: MBL fold metallo-hydrolase [Tissierellaceae bacterium]|nr:MBL fold metallo-hydrolase [Tissierellaceae bacterium]
MEIIRVTAGVYGVNCYIVYDNTKEGIVVDPGGDADEILEIIKEKEINIKYIVLTHGHGDHIGGLVELKNTLKVPIMIHGEDRTMLADGSKNLSPTMAMGRVEVEPDILLKDGDIIKMGNQEILVIHTPGHTKGGIALKVQDNIITGDTLFTGSIGRTDLLGGDYSQLIESIKEKLFIYPDETKVYPGHGPSSTIGREKVANPFLK